MTLNILSILRVRVATLEYSKTKIHFFGTKIMILPFEIVFFMTVEVTNSMIKLLPFFTVFGFEIKTFNKILCDYNKFITLLNFVN